MLETKFRRSEDARDDLEREVEGLRDELASRNNDGGGEAGSTTSGIPNIIRQMDVKSFDQSCERLLKSPTCEASQQ